jgi:DNA-binding FadR family transcriptional regulator
MTIRRYPLVQQVSDVLRERIRNGEWPLGGKIPSENDFAAELEVGRSTVREAIRQLVGSGMLAARQGAGVFVIATEEAEEWATTLRKAGIADVIEVRLAIEVEAARLAAIRRTDDDLAIIQRALAVREGVSSGKRIEIVATDLAYHTAIVEAAGNPVLARLFATFLPRLEQAMLDYLDVLDLPASPRHLAGDEHRDLVSAIWRRDVAAAERIARDHLERMREKLGAVVPDRG